jgi:mRNA interferase MazF
MTRGEIWWADLGVPFGSEPGFKRPVLVIQDDAYNKSNLNTVIVIAITSNLLLGDAPGNVLFTKKESGLAKDSIINVSQIVTLDKARLVQKAGKLKNNLMKEVEKGISMVIGMD